MKTSEILEDHTYSDGINALYFRTVEFILLDKNGQPVVWWHTDGFTGKRGDRIKTHGRCKLHTFARWARKDITA